jgi:putative DNA primase/helicase
LPRQVFLFVEASHNMHGSKRPSYNWEIERLPAEMVESARWVNWKAEERDGKFTKVPYVPGSRRKASSTDAVTWGTFWEAADASTEGDCGIGFVLGEGWLGVDFDDVADATEPNGMEPWVWDWLVSHDCYAEWSVSGTGIHVIARDTVLPEWSANRRGNLEVYQRGRYFTVSGRAVFVDRQCTRIQDAVHALCRARLARVTVEPSEPTEARRAAPSVSLDASAADWALACAMAQRGLPASVIESALATKMREEGRSVKADRPDYVPNTVAKALEMGSRRVSFESRQVSSNPPKLLEFKPFEKREFPSEMREEIVGGLLRRGEVCNWIGSPKTGKSWLLHRLIMGMVGGCGFTCKFQNDLFVKQGRVLLVDVELHPETLENRLHSIANQMKVSSDKCRQGLDVMTLRGQWATLDDVEGTVEQQPAGTWQMIALDAFYRFIPAGMRENENADMTQIYNQIDRIAAKANAAILVVHHTTKGTQTEKGTMDVGAGAGAIGRATDSHVTFLRHADDGYIVMSAETRSFKRPKARVMHVDWPDIAFDDTKDASKLWHPNCKPSDE